MLDFPMNSSAIDLALFLRLLGLTSGDVVNGGGADSLLLDVGEYLSENGDCVPCKRLSEMSEIEADILLSK